MTALSDQLKNLATATTKSFEIDINRRKSLLFNEKEATKIDSITCYEKALKAFHNLCHIEPRLVEFSESLYAEDSLQHEPSQLTQEERESLNEKLGRFITLLFPHLTLPGTLVALEWLVYKYHIHLYNVTDLLRCVFPYHETALFPKFVQLLNFKDPTIKAWHWLEPIAKSGVPLTKQELTKMCTRDVGVVIFVCDSVRTVMKTCDKHDNAVRIVCNFLTSTIVHILLSPVGDETKSRVLSQCQDVIDKGLKSRSNLYRSAIYTILHCASHKLTINKELLNQWIQRILKRPINGLEFESAGLVSMILLTQHASLSTEKLSNRFSKLIQSIPQSKRLLIEKLEEKRLEKEHGITEEFHQIKTVNDPVQMEVESEYFEETATNSVNLVHTRMEFIDRIKLKDLEMLSIIWTGGNFSRPMVDITSEIKAICHLKVLVARAILERDKYQTLKQKLPWLLTRLVPLLVYPESQLRIQALYIIKDLSDEFGISDLPGLLSMPTTDIESDPEFLVQPPYAAQMLPHLLPLLEAPLPDQTVTCSYYRLLCAAMKFFNANVMKSCSSQLQDQFFSRVLRLIECEVSEEVVAAVLRHVTPTLFLSLNVDKRISLLQTIFDKPLTFNLAWAVADKLPMDVPVLDHFLREWLPKDKNSSLKTLRELKRHRNSLNSSKESDTSQPESILRKLNTLLSSLEANCDALDKSAWKLMPLLIHHLKWCLDVVPPRRHRLASEGDLSELLDLMDVDTEVDNEDSGEERGCPAVEGCIQQLLACMLSITTKHKLSSSTEAGDSSLIGQSLSIDPILSCLTTLMNNQIHNQVLLVISELAKLFPFLVVHNLVNLVTLIEQRLLPLDDSHSLHVLSRLIGSAIPSCVRSSPQPSEAAVRVLAVFADCRKDIPAHRRLVCLYEVVQSLSKDWQNGVLWALLTLWLTRSNLNRNVSEVDFERNLMLQLVCRFPLPDQLAAWSHLLSFLSYMERQLNGSDCPATSPKRRKIETNNSSVSNEVHPLSPSIQICLKTVSKSQHASLLAASVSLISQHLGWPTYISQLAACSEGNMDALIPHCSALLSEIVNWTIILSTRRLTSYGITSSSQSNTILAIFMEVLGKIHSAVPSVHYIDAVASLLTSNSVNVQRKAMDLLHTKLHATVLSNKKREHAALTANLLATAPLLTACVLHTITSSPSSSSRNNSESTKVEGLRQSGIVCCKEIVRLLSDKHASVFDQLLDSVFKDSDLTVDKQTRSIVQLFLAECVRQWGDAISPRFDAILSLCLNTVEYQAADVHDAAAAVTADLCARILSSVDLLYELVRNHTADMGLHLQPVIHNLLRLDVLLESAANSPADQSLYRQIIKKLSLIKKILARYQETRVLFMAVKGLIEMSSESDKIYLLSGSISLLRHHIKHVSDDTLQFIDETMRGFTRFVLDNCLEVRVKHSTLPMSELSRVEAHCIRGLADLLSRLLPGTVERLMKKTLKSCRDEIKAAQLLPFFDLISRLSKKMPVESFCDLCNTTLNIFEFMILVMKKLSTADARITIGSELECDLLIRHLLPCLSCILEAEQTNQGALPASDLTLSLIPSLMSLLDTHDLHGYEDRCETILLPVILSFIRSASGDEALLKPLQYELCLRSKSEVVSVRLQSLEGIRLMLQELEQMFLTSLLPEALPYLAECLEDDNHEVELSARRLYNEIEILLGEPITNV